MLSPAFRVREFNVQDVTSYPIKLTWDSIGGEDSGLVQLLCPRRILVVFVRKVFCIFSVQLSNSVTFKRIF